GVAAWFVLIPANRCWARLLARLTLKGLALARDSRFRKPVCWRPCWNWLTAARKFCCDWPRLRALAALADDNPCWNRLICLAPSLKIGLSDGANPRAFDCSPRKRVRSSSPCCCDDL